MSIHLITWITMVETIERQSRAAYGCLIAGQSPWARAWTAAYRLYAALSVSILSSMADTEILKGGVEDNRRHLSLMRIMNYARFIRGKTTC